jgi:hypothetical protein
MLLDSHKECQQEMKSTWVDQEVNKYIKAETHNYRHKDNNKNQIHACTKIVKTKILYIKVEKSQVTQTTIKRYTIKTRKIQ